MKIRYVAETLEKAKRKAKDLSSSDPDFHIFIVEVGKWFPLEVDPESIEDTEYQVETLNDIMKKYKENRIEANKHWQAEKNKKMNQAISEGQKQEISEEHPVALLDRIERTKREIKLLSEQTDAMKLDLQLAQEKATKAPTGDPVAVPEFDVQGTLDNIQEMDFEISEMSKKINQKNQELFPSINKLYEQQKREFEDKRTSLKKALEENKEAVQAYIAKTSKPGTSKSLTDNVDASQG